MLVNYILSANTIKFHNITSKLHSVMPFLRLSLQLRLFKDTNFPLFHGLLNTILLFRIKSFNDCLYLE